LTKIEIRKFKIEKAEHNPDIAVHVIAFDWMDAEEYAEEKQLAPASPTGRAYELMKHDVGITSLTFTFYKSIVEFRRVKKEDVGIEIQL
jgi:hypothetical protein